MKHAAGEGLLHGVGRIAVIASPEGLVHVEFLADASPKVGHDGDTAACRMRDAALRELEEYAHGGELRCPVVLDHLPPFIRRVLVALRRVPRGKTTTYGELAARAGSPGAARAVGGAMARNPVPLWVPCHRVLASGGGIGGFTPGLDLKRALLRLEGDPIQ